MSRATLLRHISRTRRGVASAIALSVLAMSVVVAAVVYEGYRAAKILLDDASVWVFNTKADVNYIGRLNSQTKELDAAVYYGNLAQTDIWQLADHVTVADRAGVAKLDPVRVVVDPVNAAPSGRVLDARGGVSVVVDPAVGAAWVGADDALSTFTGEAEPTIAGLSNAATGVVSGDGKALVVDPTQGKYWVIEYDPRKVTSAGPSKSLGFSSPAGARWTAVGDRPVAVEGNDVYLAGRSAPITVVDDTLLIPQQPGPRAGRVVVAGEAGLWAVDLDDGSIDDLLDDEMGGAPAAPVVLGGCVHAAWAGNGTYAQRCGSAAAVTLKLDGVSRSERLVFRVNGRVIALNGADGRVFLIDGETVTTVTNWDEVIPKAESTEAISSTEDLQVAECIEDPLLPPETTDDTFGAHPGLAVRLPVLDNDHDANCDALTVLMPEGWDNAADGTLSVIDNGQAFQYQAPGDAKKGTVTVDYSVSDGAGHEVPAQLTIEVTTSSLTPPEMIRPSKAVVEQGKSIDYNILVDVRDPDGDLLSVIGSTAEPGQGRVEIASNGAIRYTATSDTKPGWRQVDIEISDGASATLQQTLMVDVRAPGTQIAPTVRNDYVVGRAGTEVVFGPLVNDFDANGEQLSVVDLVADDEGSVATSVSPEGEVRLRAEVAGDYRLTYGAYDGHETAFGVIRFTVRDAGDNEPPVAVSDRAAVQRGRSIKAAVIGNDYDPDGDVLVVTRAENSDPAIPEVEVVVVDGRYVRVTAGSMPEPTRPIPVTYWVTDGVHDPVSAQLLVQVTQATSNTKPVVVDDRRRVRVNDIATIDVLANDVDPDGDPLILTGVSIADSSIGGTVWLTGSKVRFLAGSRAGRVYLDYSVDDTPLRTGLHEVTGRLEIEVIGDEQGNSAPQPRPLEMRAFAGGTASVVVPLDDIDPDGDSVHFVGLGSTGEPGSTAMKGEVEFIDGSFVYTAWPTSLGPDSFTYVVADAKGLQSASATVRVTVVKEANHRPSAVRDEITVRPNRSLLLPVLANDSDPDGDPLEITTVRVQPGSEALQVVVAEGVDGYLEVTVPGSGDYVAEYALSDRRGGTARAVIMVHADPSAPLLPPTARDDAADLAVDGSGVAVIDLLANDDDPDNMRSVDSSGVRSDLRVTDIFPTDSGELVNGVLTIEPAGQQQLFVYTVTDLDGLESKALVVIPALGDALPRLKQPVVPIEVSIDENGGSAEVQLADHIIDPDGGAVELFGSPVRATQGRVEFDGDDASGFTLTIDRIGDLSKFEGSATISVEVTDRPNDLLRSVRIDIPVVLRYTGFLPLRTEPATVEVEVLGETSLNLLDAGFVIDPNADREGSVAFSKLTAVGTELAEVSLSIDGALEVVADGDAAIGASAEYTYNVRHGDGDQFEGRLNVVVVKSTRLPPVAANLTFDRLDNDKPITTDVAISAFNPFAEDDKPLKLVQVAGPEQSLEWGSVTWDSATGSTEITFTPNSDFAGTIVVTYVIMDAGDSEYDGPSSGTPDLRRSTGTITYNLVGAPLQPPPPEIVAVRSKTVELSIDTSAENFWQGTAKDKDFIIEWAGHAPVHTNGETLVTINDLPNNVEVQFTVTAVNEMGESPPSDLSAKVRPDEVPPIPAAPRVVKEGNGQVTLEWDLIAPGDFSPIEGYQLSVNHDGIVIPEVGASTNTQTITGLNNGQPYAFTLRARNKAETNGGWSEPSSAVTGVPYTVPSAPTEVSVIADPSAIGSKVIVSWKPPLNDGGRPVQRYRVTEVNSSALNLVTASSPAYVPASLGVKQYAVQAGNEPDATVENWSEQATSASFNNVGYPSAPTINGYSAQSSAVVLDVTGPSTADDWGTANTSTRYLDYRLDGGSWQALPSDRRITGLSNCASYTVEVRARNEMYSTVGNSISVTPYGPPSAPSVSGYASGQNIVWSWNSSSNGSCSMSVTVTAGGSTVSYSSSGSYTQYVGYSSSSSMNVTVSDGRNSVSGSASVSTGGAPPPPISVSVTQGNYVSGNGCTTTCRYVAINSSGWSPGQSLTYTCYSNYGSVGPYTRNADGNGNFSSQGPCWFAIVSNVYVVINGYTSNTVGTWRNW